MPEITFTRARPPIEDVVIVLTPAEAKVLGDVAGAIGHDVYEDFRTKRHARAETWTPYDYETVGHLFDVLYTSMRTEGLLDG